MSNDEGLASWRRIPEKDCPHWPSGRRDVTPSGKTCERCGGTEDLRVCLTCGYVGCCESRGAHDTEHSRLSGHPLIRPHGCGYDFLWCYECNAFLH